jgi:predicted RNase H-like HicB family nuclease
MTEPLNEAENTADSMARYKITLYKGEDGFIVAQCPELPGCVSQGRSKAEAVRNIKEAIALYLDALKDTHERLPRVEFVDIAVPA